MVKKFLGFLIGFAPVSMVFAQTLTSSGTADSIIGLILYYISRLMILAIAFAVLMFVFGLVKYISSDEEVGKSKAKNLIINAVIGLVAATSIWGIVTFVRNTIGVTTNNSLYNTVPCTPGLPQNQGGC